MEMVEVDMFKVFDTVNHGKLLNYIAEFTLPSNIKRVANLLV